MENSFSNVIMQSNYSNKSRIAKMKNVRNESKISTSMFLEGFKGIMVFKMSWF